jgi:hypothetical protein
VHYRNRPLNEPRTIHTLYKAAGDYDGHIVNEIKVMIPCQEVMRAKDVLKELNISK